MLLEAIAAPWHICISGEGVGHLAKESEHIVLFLSIRDVPKRESPKNRGEV